MKGKTASTRLHLTNKHLYHMKIILVAAPARDKVNDNNAIIEDTGHGFDENQCCICFHT